MDLSPKIIDIVRDKKTHLPTLPVIVSRVLEIINDPNASTQDLVGVLSFDQAIANKILKLANSSYYGFSTKVDSLNMAVLVVGYNEIVNLAIGISVFSALKLKQTQSFFDIQSLWLHAIAVGTASRKLAQLTPQKQMSEQTFLSGLFHDIGKILFLDCFQEEYRQVLEREQTSRLGLYLTEKEVLGIDHATLAGMLMEQWNFPRSIVVPVRFHHETAACPESYQKDAMTIELADIICRRIGIGSSGTMAPCNDISTHQQLGLGEAEMQSLIAELTKEQNEINKFIELIR